MTEPHRLIEANTGAAPRALQCWTLVTFDPTEKGPEALMGVEVFATEEDAYRTIRDIEREELECDPDCLETEFEERLEALVSRMKANEGKSDPDLSAMNLRYELSSLPIWGSL